MSQRKLKKGTMLIPVKKKSQQKEKTLSLGDVIQIAFRQSMQKDTQTPENSASIIRLAVKRYKLIQRIDESLKKKE